MDKIAIAQLKPKQLLIFLIFVQLALFFSILFNISAAQQVLGFFYITILPGIVIVKLTKSKFERVEQILFAVGVSLVFFMGIGFFINTFGPSLGISEPLGSIPILVVTSIIMDTLAFHLWKTSNKPIGNHVLAVEHRNRTLNLVAPFLCLLPILSVIGIQLVNIPPHTNNFILLLALLAVSILTVSVAFYKQLPSETYILILFAISLTLIIQSSLFSNYLVGEDIFSEYSAFNLTLQHSYWDIQNLGRLNAMLSVTILPTIYSNIGGISGTWVFKIIYPLIFALVPVGLYQLFKSQISEKLAFLAVFFFMSNYMFFYALVELPRQIIGELFYILLFLAILKKDLQSSYKLFFFSIFSFGIIVSHYAMAYIFLGLIVAFWLINRIRKRKGVITLSMIVLFAAILFTWYIYTSSGSTFNDLLTNVNNLSQNFITDFLNPQSRGKAVLAGLGAPAINTFLHIIGQYIYNFAELLILAGFIASIVKHKAEFFKNDFNLFAFFSLLLLGACVVVPNLAGTFNMERFFHVALFFLAPFCILGGIYLLSLISRNRVNVKYLSLIIVVAVLIPVFLFQTGFIYEVTKEVSYSLPLSSYRLSPITLAYYGVLGAPEVSGAEWLSQKSNPTISVYSDITSMSIFDYTDVPNSNVVNLGVNMSSGSLIYLRQYSIQYEIMLTFTADVNTSQIISSADPINLIYSSGPCQIYEVP